MRPLPHLAILLSVAMCITGPLPAQQWYYLYPNTGGSPPAGHYGMVGFELNGSAYFGFGTNTSGISGSFYKYDPANNTISPAILYFGYRSKCVAFSLGGYGYLGLGNLEADPTPSYVTGYLHRYDPVTQNFTVPIAFPGGPRLDAIAFTIGNKAYVGGGVDVDTTLGTAWNENDLWAYDPALNQWTARADMPGTIQAGVSFAANGKGYVIPESSTALWEYDPVANTWATRAPFPGGARYGMSAMVQNGLCYVGCGSNMQSFFAYDPLTNTWSAAPAMWNWGGRTEAVTFTINNESYLFGGGQIPGPLLNDLWRFGPSTVPAPDTWTQRPFLPAAGREHPIAFGIGTKGYAGGGGAATDFWEYDPVPMTWTARAAMPANADEAFTIGGIAYVLRSAVTGNFFAYDPVSNTWTPRADLPGGARSAAASFAIEGKGYIGTGLVNAVRMSDLWEYDPAMNTWTQRADRPGFAARSASGFAIGNKGYIAGGNFAGTGTNLGDVHRYDPVTNTWTAVASLPMGNRQYAQAFTLGNMAYLGGGIVGGSAYMKRWDRYDPATNTWIQLADAGGNYRYNGVGFTIGSKGYLFGGKRNPTSGDPGGGSAFAAANDLWEFDPSMINVPVRVFLGGPFDGVSGLMSDQLRTAGLLTTLDPYGALGYPYPGGNYTDLPIAVPTTTGNNAVVDRVVIELRDPVNPATVRATRHAWLQRDGDVVDMNGTSPVRFTLPPGNYYVAVRHRNHLGAMTATALPLSLSTTTIDLTLAATATYGTSARKTVGSAQVLWPGDVTFNGQVLYTGAGNDRDPILQLVGGTTPNNTVSLYSTRDVSMDGVVKYTGTNNDRDPILQSVGSTTPNNVRVQQLP